MNMTRRNFMLAVGTTLSATAVGTMLPTKKDDWFEDLVVDRYYELQGGMYGDTGGWGNTYPAMGVELMANLQYWDCCRVIDDRMAQVEKAGYYLTPTQYIGKPFRFYDRIPLTERWLREFYRRHKDDKPEDWYRRYDEYYAALRAAT